MTIQKIIPALGLAFLSITGGCTHGVGLSNQNTSLVVLRQAAKHASPGGVRYISPNGREVYSKYFPPRGGTFEEDARNYRRRAVSIIRILGDRRPYDVEFKVNIEYRRKDSSYRVVAQDQGLADQVRERFRDHLFNRPDKRDFIDDFRAF